MKQKWFFKTFSDTCSNQRRAGMVCSCNQAINTLPFWSISMTTGRVRGEAAFIDINERLAATYIALTKTKIRFPFYIASLFVPCHLFFRVIPSCFRLYQIQPWDTPKCRAISNCVISPCASTWRRNASRSRLREPFGPGFLYDRPSSTEVQLWTLPRDTWNLRAASALLPPLLTNSITRLRKSDEHLMKHRIIHFNYRFK